MSVPRFDLPRTWKASYGTGLHVHHNRILQSEWEIPFKVGVIEGCEACTMPSGPMTCC